MEKNKNNSAANFDGFVMLVLVRVRELGDAKIAQ